MAIKRRATTGRFMTSPGEGSDTTKYAVGFRVAIDKRAKKKKATKKKAAKKKK